MVHDLRLATHIQLVPPGYRRLSIYADNDWNELAVVSESPPEDRQKLRILAALGIDGDRLPLVDENTLLRYFKYLSENCVLPASVYELF